MASNAQIIMGVRPLEIEDPVAQYSRLAAIQGAQQQNQLARMKMDEYGRTRQQEEGLRNYLTRSDLKTPEGRAGLAQYGAPGLAISKSLIEQDTAGLTQQKLQFDTAAAKQKFIAQAQRDTSQNPSDANITAYKEDLIANPLFLDSEKQQMAANADRLLAMPVEERRVLMSSRGATSGELKPQVSVGPTGIVQTPAYGGAATIVPGTSEAFQMTPAQIETNKIAQQRLITEQQRVGLEGQRVGLEGQRVGLEGRKTAIAEAADVRKAAGLEGLSPKDLQKRESVFPQATSAIKGFESKSDSFIKDIEKLRDHPGLPQITGIAAGRLPGLTSDGRAAQALFEKITAKGGFQALQEMREASKTGGALGNVSNQEGKQLTASFAAIDRKQDASDVRAALDQAIGDIQGAKVRMREAYDNTYAYKSPAASAGAPVAASNVVMTPDGKSYTFSTPAAAAQFKKAAGIP
jgi:hypothetical protein